MAINVSTIPPTPLPRPRIVVEMDWEDAEALAAMGYGLNGPYSAPSGFVGGKEQLNINVYNHTLSGHAVVYPSSASDMRDRLRAVGRALSTKLGLGY